MDTPFDYNNFVTGSDFISRKNEVTILSNIIKNKGNALIYDAPKTGKKSLVNHTLSTLRKLSYSFYTCHIPLLNIRSPQEFCRLFAHRTAACVSNTLEDWNRFTARYLPWYEEQDDAVFSEEEIREILFLPQRVNRDYGINLIVYIEDFQSVHYFEQAGTFLRLLREVWEESTDTAFIITGSFINAMKQLFEVSDIFQGFAERVTLSPLSRQDVYDHLKRSFLKVGRVVSQELSDKVYELTKGHPWYLWQLASICFAQTKGYLTGQIISESIYALIATHSIRFKENIYNLTRHQISYIKAILEEEDHFTSVNIVDKYHLNSNANLFRVKEALCKKEIIVFDDRNRPSIIDPVFELWLKDYYFAQ